MFVSSGVPVTFGFRSTCSLGNAKLVEFGRYEHRKKQWREDPSRRRETSESSSLGGHGKRPS